ncbi:hypothetical protein F2Q69_00031466 [Brassica cretica]|uniref:Uncharacterized protein n=1 Tax=Brassica cretica TaxID=69181 RepID=A0A8S9S600_BRACR|nr:hypothetical protein F2Q69_00031466 [Brassica cretica]
MQITSMLRQASCLLSRSVTSASSKSVTAHTFPTEFPSKIDSTFVESWKRIAPNMGLPTMMHRDGYEDRNGDGSGDGKRENLKIMGTDVPVLHSLPKTPPSFMKPRPSTASSIPTRLTVTVDKELLYSDHILLNFPTPKLDRYELLYFSNVGFSAFSK